MHASCIAIGRQGVLVRGPSGSGKSDLCLRLLHDGAKPQCRLVADDQVRLNKKGKKISASAPKALRGMLEIRGLGIAKTPFCKVVDLALVIDLARTTAIDRMPEKQELSVSIEGVKLPRIQLDPSLPSAVARVRAALSHFALKSQPTSS